RRLEPGFATGPSAHGADQPDADWSPASLLAARFQGLTTGVTGSRRSPSVVLGVGAFDHPAARPRAGGDVDDAVGRAKPEPVHGPRSRILQAVAEDLDRLDLAADHRG